MAHAWEATGRSVPRKRCGEESPDSIGQGVPWLTRERRCQNDVDGKCHREYTAMCRKARGKGEKVVQETTGLSRKRRRMANPVRSKIE